MSSANLSMQPKWHQHAARQYTAGSRAIGYPSLRWSMFAVSLVALVTSGYLAWASFTSSSVAGCGGGGVFNCDHVLHSRWSTVLSVPVSVPAIATHLLILGMLLWQPVSKRLTEIRWSAIGFAALAAGGAALWFIGLQVFWMQHLCPYCLIAHTAGIVLAVLFLIARPISRSSLGWVGSGAAASLACLIALQSLNEIPQSYEVIEYPELPAASSPVAAPEMESDFAAPQALPDDDTLFAPPAGAEPETTDLIPHGAGLSPSRLNYQAASLVAALLHPATLFYGQVATEQPQQPQPHTVRVLNNTKLDTSAWPIIGSPDAELVFVELFDYTCEHCQRTHRSMEAARKQFGDRLAILMLPVPLDRKCNPTVNQTHASHNESCELSKLAVAVWLTDRTKFAEFHDYLFESKPSYSQALGKAQSLVGQSELDKVLRSSLPADYIAKHVTLYQKAGAGAIPKLLFSRATSVGAVESPAAMINLINQHLK